MIAYALSAMLTICSVKYAMKVMALEILKTVKLAKKKIAKIARRILHSVWLVLMSMDFMMNTLLFVWNAMIMDVRNVQLTGRNVMSVNWDTEWILIILEHVFYVLIVIVVNAMRTIQNALHVILTIFWILKEAVRIVLFKIVNNVYRILQILVKVAAKALG